MEQLDAKKLERGMRVIKISGDRSGEIATVRGIDRGMNLIGVQFDTETKITLGCDAGEFQIYTAPKPHLTMRPPEGTVARGSLK